MNQRFFAHGGKRLPGPDGESRMMPFDRQFRRGSGI
jgi:hypothetical protein